MPKDMKDRWFPECHIEPQNISRYKCDECNRPLNIYATLNDGPVMLRCEKCKIGWELRPMNRTIMYIMTKLSKKETAKRLRG
jgi:hypothetical protein